jgi:hypothetical protein
MGAKLALGDGLQHHFPISSAKALAHEQVKNTPRFSFCAPG